MMVNQISIWDAFWVELVVSFYTLLTEPERLGGRCI